MLKRLLMITMLAFGMSGAIAVSAQDFPRRTEMPRRTHAYVMPRRTEVYRMRRASRVYVMPRRSTGVRYRHYRHYRYYRHYYRRR